MTTKRRQSKASSSPPSMAAAKKPKLTATSSSKRSTTPSSSSASHESKLPPPPQDDDVVVEMSTEANTSGDAAEESEVAAKLNSKRSTASSSSAKKTPKPRKRATTKPRQEKKKNAAKVVAETVKEEEEDEEEEEISEAMFVGGPIDPEEARRRWPNRYKRPPKEEIKPYGTTSANDEYEKFFLGVKHFNKAVVDGTEYELNDDAYVKAGEDIPHYIGKIIEMFEANDGLPYFTAQWYYRTTDTVIEGCFEIDPRRIFYSDVTDYNALDCLVEKLNIVRLGLDIDPVKKSRLIESCMYYCDTKYLLPYSTFINYPPEKMQDESDNSLTISNEVDIRSPHVANSESRPTSLAENQAKPKGKCLDLYSGCGGMSSGLCLGANLSDLNLVTGWAVDLNEHALKSLKLNHPETQVFEDFAEDFLSLMKEWRHLCIYFDLVKLDGVEKPLYLFNANEGVEEVKDEEIDVSEGEVFEVEKILEILYGNVKELNEKGKKVKKNKKSENPKEKKLIFKVRWKGYGPEEDTWEPLDSLTDCKECIREFVCNGYKSNFLPLPGDVDVICGGPPCQGVSGFNRFRDGENPLNDERNQQLVVYMDIIEYLHPKFVLMENVVDILKFAGGYLGRYALGRIVSMGYQARLGMMCAGAYGLPQFRMRVFLWGSLPTEVLPEFPLPTHDVVFRGTVPTKWEHNCVAYNEGHGQKLGRKLLLDDALTDLPKVLNSENRDVMPYENEPRTGFQKFIRLSRDGMLGTSKSGLSFTKNLYDHRPLNLNADDFERVCHIPKKKGANFRDMPGVLVRDDNTVYLDPNMERLKVNSGKDLVPDYALTFVKGKSKKPFRRLWWDEIVSTVVTRAEPHNQAVLHPSQDRVLTVRENARLQGFPDYYQLCGPVKERYMQIGNAVAVPVSRALGYVLAQAYIGLAGEDPLIPLPKSLHLPEGCHEDGSGTYLSDEEPDEEEVPREDPEVEKSNCNL